MNIQIVVEQLKLGEITECKPLMGGALHSMFKLKTSTGTYAIKKINSHIAERKNFQQAYELSEKISAHMLQAQIPAVCSLTFDGMHIIQVEKEYFIIYPFVEGKLLDDKNLTLDHAQCIGSLYASMHRSWLTLSDIDKAHYDYFDDHHWDTLIRKTQQSSLIELLPSIFYWNQAYTESIPELNRGSRR